MTKTLFTAVSAIAILSAGPTLAADDAHNMKPGSQAAADASTGSISKDAKKAWENTKDDVSEAANKIGDAAKETYKDAKQALHDSDDSAKISGIQIDPRRTADGMIGEPVYNADGERVAKVHDIILDSNGQATMVVLADGDFTGLGKLVAFDYNILAKRSSDGDMIVPLDEAMIDNAASFSYDRSEYSNKVRVIPSNGYSAAELLDGKLVDPQGEKLAEIDNLVLRNGQASQIIVGYNQMLGMGGKQAALPFQEAELSRHQDSMNFKLSANETRDFKAYKNTAMN